MDVCEVVVLLLSLVLMAGGWWRGSFSVGVGVSLLLLCFRVAAVADVAMSI